MKTLASMEEGEETVEMNIRKLSDDQGRLPSI